MPHVCPVCAREDQIRKISAIADSGTVNTHGYSSSFGVAYGRGGIIPVSASNHHFSVSQTPLAAATSFPFPVVEPRSKLRSARVLFIIAAMFLAPVALLKMFIPSHTSWTLLLLVFGYTGIFWLPGVLLVLRGIRDLRRFREADPIRRRAYFVWNQLYYCFRDDVVFMPGEQTCYPTNSIRKFLLDRAAQLA